MEDYYWQIDVWPSNSLMVVHLSASLLRHSPHHTTIYSNICPFITFQIYDNFPEYRRKAKEKLMEKSELIGKVQGTHFIIRINSRNKKNTSDILLIEGDKNGQRVKSGQWKMLVGEMFFHKVSSLTSDFRCKENSSGKINNKINSPWLLKKGY